MLLLSFGLLFLFGCCSSSILVLFQNLLQLNEETAFGAFCKTCRSLDYEAAIDRDFPLKITLENPKVKLKHLKENKNTISFLSPS